MKCPECKAGNLVAEDPDEAGEIYLFCDLLDCGYIGFHAVLSPAGLEAVEEMMKELHTLNLHCGQVYIKLWEKIKASDPLFAAIAKKIEENKP